MLKNNHDLKNEIEDCINRGTSIFIIKQQLCLIHTLQIDM